MIKRAILFSFVFGFGLIACQSPEKNTEYYLPWVELDELFHDVQMEGIFPDSKTFVDYTPKRDPAAILEDYLVQKDEEGFDLSEFVEVNFNPPFQPDAIEIDASKPMIEHLNGHWASLTRSSEDAGAYSSLIPLPNEYVVPGGRFREIYYWDSYFTMIGLGVSGRVDLIESMLDNFAYQIETIGYIPNGNRTYFLGRSQPPFFGAMVNLYAQYTSMEEAAKYLPALQAEYDFWMEGTDQLTEANPAHRRVVLLDDVILNRYYDDQIEPRPESYKEDVELAHGMSEERANKLFLDLRAACESGWDFSARWFADGNDFASIRTSEIAPIDLNSILYHTENVLSDLYRAQDETQKANEFEDAASSRAEAINAIFWNAEASIFMDVLWEDGSFTDRITAASFYPMYFNAADDELAETQVPELINELRKDGGFLTSPYGSGQQWDSPNGWAPLQWIAYKGLDQYGFGVEAKSMADDWLSVNNKVYRTTGKMMEKYNVADTTLLAGGGEYPTQDGFGWTNGIVLALDADIDKY